MILQSNITAYEARCPLVRLTLSKLNPQQDAPRDDVIDGIVVCA